jgi:hypothetical protein
VEYTEDFNWVSVGHATQQRAVDSWHGANPGGMGVFVYSPANAAECASLDERAWRFLNPVEAKRRFSRGGEGTVRFAGDQRGHICGRALPGVWRLRLDANGRTLCSRRLASDHWRHERGSCVQHEDWRSGAGSLERPQAVVALGYR